MNIAIICIGCLMALFVVRGIVMLVAWRIYIFRVRRLGKRLYENLRKQLDAKGALDVAKAFILRNEFSFVDFWMPENRKRVVDHREQLEALLHMTSSGREALEKMSEILSKEVHHAGQ